MAITCTRAPPVGRARVDARHLLDPAQRTT